MLETSRQVRVSGRVRASDYFVIREIDRLDPGAILAVLRGEIAGVIVRGAIGDVACRHIAANFWRHPRRRQREDNVPAFFLGTYHYGKTLDAYFDEADRFRDVRREIFAGTEDVFGQVTDPLGARLAEGGVTLRVAHHQGRDASPFVVRSWSGSGEFALEPHDDGAQLLCALQRGFEIQQVAHAPAAVAVNVCVENDGEGHLYYWNLEPDAADRALYGLEETGYPYPPQAVEGVQRLVVPIHRGDVYCFNGKHLHAVSGHGGGDGFRSTISWLMGFSDPQTVIYWS
jgi:hypothetical protein